MQWFYAINDQQRGPVDDAELSRLRSMGTVKDDSLVWREGMADWQPYLEVLGTAAIPPLMGASAVSGVRCVECGHPFSADQVVRLADAFVCANCKPIRLQKLSEGVTDNSVEKIRKDHIKHEASVKSVGFLYFISAALIGLASLGAMAGSRGDGIAVAVVLCVFAAGLIAAGVGIRSLKPWARIVSGVLSGLGLLGVPIGTIINAYILYLLFSSKGSMVFSEEYKGVIAATPHIKYRTSIVVWILLGLVLLLILLGLVGWFVSSSARR